MDPEQITAILSACLERGFRPPLCLCAISVNGAVLAVRYTVARGEDQGMEMEVLAQHLPEPVFVLPINMMITDTLAEAARVVVERAEAWRFADLN